jgi:hypothetical protein
VVNEEVHGLVLIDQTQDGGDLDGVRCFYVPVKDRASWEIFIRRANDLLRDACASHAELMDAAVTYGLTPLDGRDTTEARARARRINVLINDDDFGKNGIGGHWILMDQADFNGVNFKSVSVFTVAFHEDNL